MNVLVCVWTKSGVYLIATDACNLPLEARHLAPPQSLGDERLDQSPLSSLRLRMNQLVAVLCTLRTIEDTPVIILHIASHASLTPHARGFVAISSRTGEHLCIGAYECALVRQEPSPLPSLRRMCTRREHTCSAHVLLPSGRAAGSIIHSGDAPTPTHTCNEKRLPLQKRSQSERIARDAIAPLALCTAHCQLCKPSICCYTNSYALQHFPQTVQSTLLNTSANAHMTLNCSASLCSNLLTSLRLFEQFPIFALVLANITRDGNISVLTSDLLTIGGVGTTSAPRDDALRLAPRIYGSIHVAALFDKSDAQCRLDFDSFLGLLICAAVVLVIVLSSLVLRH